MKVSFELQPNQKLILRILKETGKLHALALSRVLRAIDNAPDDFASFIKIVTNMRDPFPGFDALGKRKRPDYEWQLEQEIDGLRFVGLIATRLHDFGHFGGGLNIGKELTIWGLDVELTEEGSRVAEAIKYDRRVVVRPATDKQTSVFVACAFGLRDIDALCERCLMSACTALGYDCVRVDLTEPPQTITEAIMDGISESAAIIADLTHARPSVYFEVGFAHALGLPILLTCRRDHYRGIRDDTRVHFDLEQFKISFWTRTKQGAYRWAKDMKPHERLAKLLPALK